MTLLRILSKFKIAGATKGIVEIRIPWSKQSTTVAETGHRVNTQGTMNKLDRFCVEKRGNGRRILSVSELPEWNLKNLDLR